MIRKLPTEILGPHLKKDHNKSTPFLDYEPSDEESDDDYDESEVVAEDLSHLDPDAVITLPQ